jgi:acyl-CoA thioester hydrolase
VRYADTDAMGVVYYANYLAFFETGRVEALRQIGASYSDVVQRGVHLAVVEALARYHRPAVFDDVLLVSCRVDEIRRAQFTFHYEAYREQDQVLIASGHTSHACIDATSLKAVRLPEWLLDALRRMS